ncbi:hypothetical protein [Enterovibrio norvegicus]|uniref:hypothetical protein n=1 Tax=Enterovibrio norvegicus TaxID=188144 RepID=UPI00352F359B
MLKRRFYRLDEISDVTPLTKGDLLSAVERGELQLCAWVDAKALGATKSRTELYPYSQIPLFDYRGVLGLSPDDSVKCIQTEESKVEVVLINEPERVSRWRHVSDDFPDAKQCRQNEALPLAEQRELPFFAFASIGTRTVLGEDLQNLAKAGVEEQRKAGAKRLVEAFLNVDNVLEKQSMVISREQLRFDLNLVNKVFGLETVNKERKHLTSDNPTASQSRGRRNRVLDVIERALKANPQGDYHAIHKLIRDEHNQHENKADFSAKSYDIDEIIQSIDSDVITWRTKSGDVKEMSRKYFEDSISNIRKELGYSKR